jgi:hypothetical protein
VIQGRAFETVRKHTAGSQEVFFCFNAESPMTSFSLGQSAVFKAIQLQKLSKVRSLEVLDKEQLGSSVTLWQSRDSAVVAQILSGRTANEKVRAVDKPETCRCCSVYWLYWCQSTNADAEGAAGGCG